MQTKTKDIFGIDSLAESWTQSMNDINGMMAQTWATHQKSQEAKQQGQQNMETDTFETVTAIFKSWQTIAAVLATPESVDSLLEGTGTLPDIFVKFAQAVISNLIEYQNKMSQSATHWEKLLEGLDFKNTDENGFNIWSEIYQKEFQKFFQIPQLGLTRNYQERFNEMMDKYHLFQVNYSEFLRMLSLPFQQSITIIQEKVANLAEAGELPKDPQEYYQMWIKNLEDHFMTLFQTPEYIKVLTNTVSTLSHFSKAKDAVMEDFLQGLPVAPRSELDDLSKEVFELKRRIRRLEKENRAKNS